ncbi:MAG: aspartyl/glutamyl-tRNA amidotransferase subunit B [Elusimicrobia bacterium RIFOXYB12_FULL_50_12]|nr:MAG: aspartyl/glutamyl-tRNA amidotransferase subunit B [Elusimicrobia bacterium RIFOXYA12_FULL_49_49]OGS09598.1 MAG: aspartyl/glutamyl-tRNA amidotransferase subunit B [Elusimicrobia bacterium RIFOXYB1_FULL_48_9]OGS16518.1 MAG: aspartyl/glutamyl-tRNA amidotransferase subunit B [Elusimicrobia bacterium RIFOXYA2_FULL_47_53]OGS26043.1 MAG: aspartyl/glutamyl-tRNA amidotransferase subunit B [Elusimicrobia bacterium RIFOXYB12_FULL_50_12]OGS29640.1 MAG: aspartyl/glutamyl-tRNA amidotransferase subuni
MDFETVIGLEVHAQLKTDSKIFCSCPTEFGKGENTNICPVCTGQPGVLPVLNEKAVEFIAKTGLALNCRVNTRSIFARKQYFYPDLPKNYQISQYELPVCESGFVDIKIDKETKRIRVHRIHLEEDAGKLLHAIGARELDHSLVDYNRTGVPLMEIVSEADMRSPEEAYQYLSALKNILEYLGVSDCDMEEGKFRCDANISLRPYGQKEFGTKAELKNMNTLKGVREALEHEVERQAEILSAGGKIIQETRLWDAGLGETRSMRVKEEAHDYRYFPEPDLVPIELDEKYVSAVKAGLPELPEARSNRFAAELGLSEYDASVLTSEKPLADYFEAALPEKDAAKLTANWVISELLGRLNASGTNINTSPVGPENLRGLLKLIQNGTISGKIAKTVFDDMFNTGKNAGTIVEEKGLTQISDEAALAKLCGEAIAETPKAVEEYRSGKERALGSLVGVVMKKTQGKANPGLVNKILKEKLS